MDKYFDYEHIVFDVSNKYIAHGALTNSKRASQFVEGVYPTFFSKGYQAFAYDLDGEKYLDFLCALGSSLFGYANHDITEAMIKACRRAPSLSLGTPSEAYFAMKFQQKFPHCEKIRILKSGSEGCSAAVRIAKTYNDTRNIVLSEGYHGWHDRFTYLTEPAYGVPQITDIKRLDSSSFDFSSLDECNVSAVIIEPVDLDVSSKRRQFLERLREACTKTDTVLIYDETITAYRFPSYSVAQYWGIEPDICVQGKALANGMPISVVGGRAKYMDGDYFVSSTFAGEQVTLAAAIECTKLISNYYHPDRLWEAGSEFTEKMNFVLKPVGIEMFGYPTRGSFRGNANVKALFCQEMCKAGVFFHPNTWFYNLDLHRYHDQVTGLAKTVVRKIVDGDYRMEGSLPQNPYLRKY